MERVTPHSDYAERAVLGAAIQSKDALADIMEEIRPEDFYSEQHKVIYETILNMYDENKAIDLKLVCEELERIKALEAVGGRAYVAGIAIDLPTVANAGEYAKRVADKALLRSLIKTNSEVTDLCYEGKLETQDILNHAEQSIYLMSQNRQKRDYTTIKEILVENIRIIGENSKRKGEVVGTPSGFKSLDKLTNGFQKSDLVIVAARPSMGKTAFVLNIAEQISTKEKKSVIIFSLEMSKEQLGQRILSMHARVEMNKLKQGDLTDEEWKNIAIASDELSNAQLVIDDTASISIPEMRNKCRRLSSEKGLDLVIIDYLQLMTYERKAENRQVEISAISRSLKLLARDLNCPIIVLSQLSRAPELRQDKRPILSDLRDSGSIEQDADIVMFLYRDEYYNKESEKPGVCEVSIAKNRNGATDRTELAWIERYTKFGEIAR